MILILYLIAVYTCHLLILGDQNSICFAPLLLISTHSFSPFLVVASYRVRWHNTGCKLADLLLPVLMLLEMLLLTMMLLLLLLLTMMLAEQLL